VAADSSFWVREQDGTMAYISTVVDDMLISSADEPMTLRIIHDILSILPGRHLGIATHFNGMKITWLDSPRSVILTQPGHIQDLVDKFGHLADLTIPHTLPVKGGLKLCKGGTSENPCSDALDVERYHYRGLIGGLSYISCCTRPDITFIINQLASYSNAPTIAHWDVAIGVVRYLRHTIRWGISLGHGGAIDKAWVKTLPEHKVVAFADANHGTGMDDKRSVSGIIMHVYGGPVSWASKKQAVTSTSTCESEYRALSMASREALWLAKIVSLFGIAPRPFTIKGDNKSAINTIQNHTTTQHTKHIEIHHDFMKDRYKAGDLDYEHIPGKDNPADILTKALETHKFQQFRHDMGMRQLPPQ